MENINDEDAQEEIAAEQETAETARSEESEEAAETEEPPVREPADGEPNDGPADSDGTVPKDAPQEGSAAEDTDRKGLFGRKKKDTRDQQIEDLTDRVQRQMAEFDNFRKRSEKEKSAMFEIGAKSVLEKILPAVDNFERGLSSLDDSQKDDAFVQGMEKVYRQLTGALEGIGVTPIEAVGQHFDPNFHNAVQHVEDEEADENIVVEEFQKGYMYRDSVLRHSMVKVAN